MPPKLSQCLYWVILFTLGTLTLNLSGNARSAPSLETVPQLDQLSTVDERESPSLPSPLVAQIPSNIPRNPPAEIIPRPQPPSITPLPQQQLPSPLPPPDQLLQPSAPSPVEPEPPNNAPQTVDVQKFDVQGSTVFDADELAALAWQATHSELNPSDLVQSYCSSGSPASDESAPEETAQSSDPSRSPALSHNCCPDHIDSADLQSPQSVSLSFDQLLQARTAITQLYINCGYITSGAILPPQTPADHDNTVTIQVVEGSLETINVTGTHRLHSSYVRSRLAIATTPPLQRQRLLNALQLLQLDPLIRRISAELQAGTRPSTNILQVEVTEADSFRTDLTLDNNRTPSVGSFERGISLTEANLLGFGDGLTVGYVNTDGSNGINTSYRLPVNPRNGAFTLSYGYTHSNVIERPFDILGISADSFFYELTFRQPLYQTPNTEFDLGLTLSRQETQTRLSFDNIGPFPLSPGADNNGRTRITAARFTQEWTQQSPGQVLAARSQFSLGLDFLDSTINQIAPDSRFFAWRGQAQAVRQLDTAGTLVLARTDLQLTGDPLVPLEQFGLGGQNSVRGYRQDALLTDNGILASIELQYPIIRSRDLGGKIYLAPFLNAGMGWNITSKDPNPRTLVGTGLGLVWRQDSQRENNNLSAQVYFGIPLVSIDNSREGTWQESGLYFSIGYSPF